MSSNTHNGKRKLGRPSANRTKQEQKEFLRKRSNIYYSDPVRKLAQKNKMIEYRNKNRELVNYRQRKRRAKVRLENNLNVIWSKIGLI